MLADEPTGNLDSATGTGGIDLLLELDTTYGATLIIATHDPAIAARCDRTISVVRCDRATSMVDDESSTTENDESSTDWGRNACIRRRSRSGVLH